MALAVVLFYYCFIYGYLYLKGDLCYGFNIPPYRLRFLSVALMEKSLSVKTLIYKEENRIVGVIFGKIEV